MDRHIECRYQTTNTTRDLASKSGVDDGTRTRDGRNHNPGLYQLSYVHHRRTSAVARPAGIEPATAGLEGRCSIRLSYGRLINQQVRAPIVIYQADIPVPSKPYRKCARII
jgi:hypothetical protein